MEDVVVKNDNNNNVVVYDHDDEYASAIVATAHLLLRGLVPAFVGFPVGCRGGGGVVVDGRRGEGKDNGGGVGGAGGGGGVRASAFQMTYKKDLPRFGRNGEMMLYGGSGSVYLARCS